PPKVVRDGVARERFHERDQIGLLLGAEAKRSDLLRALEASRGATLVVEFDHVRQRRQPAGVRVRRSLRDGAQARRAKGPGVGRVLSQWAELGLASRRVVAELTSAIEYV